MYLEVATWYHIVPFFYTMGGLSLDPCAHLRTESDGIQWCTGRGLNVSRYAVIRLSNLTGPFDLSCRAWLKYAKPMQQRWSLSGTPPGLLFAASS